MMLLDFFYSHFDEMKLTINFSIRPYVVWSLHWKHGFLFLKDSDYLARLKNAQSASHELWKYQHDPGTFHFTRNKLCVNLPRLCCTKL